MVLIDATPLQSEHRVRGVGNYLLELLRASEEQGMRPLYVASSWGGGGSALPDFVPKERLLTAPRPHKPAQAYWIYNEFFLRYALLRTRPRVFFAPDFNGLVLNPFGRTVATLYDLTPFKLGDLGDPFSAARWRTYARRLKRADHLVAISSSAKQDAVQILSIPPERVTVTPLAVNHQRFKPSVAEGRYAGAGRYLLHGGAFNPNKNQAGLLQAFARLAPHHPGLELRFFGPWAPEHLEWLGRERQRLGLDERVKHVGYVATEDLPSLYGNAAAFVFPSLEEGFGLPVLEAMASGAPVVTSNCSSLPEAAGEAALLVDPRDPEAIAAAVRRVLEEPGLAEHLREKGYAQAARFTWEATARKTWEVLLGQGCSEGWVTQP
ncbi:glycosyltransferase family 4 protein [Calidithermus timidus]|jgi:glycosyltransferase involved in cell wall biosynthesis|uniref:glycosyltransferase family 4 protein n=1 Tax=Calidithermus timidus TaxID=307124 RepID=UPI000360AD2B|nr:glycosyltransferase family 1 protein [Calidithermus timidus]